MKQNIVNDPFQYMILKRELILQVVSQASTLPRAWNTLIEKIPEIEDVIRYNTFKVYAPILVKVGKAFDEKEMELDKVRQKVISLNKAHEMPQEESAPKRFKGWGVQCNRGYYRLFKKINGKVKWLYIGKKWSQAIAEKKLDRFRLDKIV